MRTPLLLVLLGGLGSAADVGPFPVLAVVDGETFTVDDHGHPRPVRLQWVVVPLMATDAGVDGTPARDFLRKQLPAGTSVRLHCDKAPNADAGARVTAVVTVVGGADTVQERLIGAGFSPYFHANGDAPEPLHSALTKAQAAAAAATAGYWGTAPQWLTAHEKPRASKGPVGAATRAAEDRDRAIQGELEKLNGE